MQEHIEEFYPANRPHPGLSVHRVPSCHALLCGG